jgi:nitrous oxide reductase accessory protein NosL
MKKIFAFAAATVFLAACQNPAPDATLPLPQEVEVVDETVVDETVVDETVVDETVVEAPVAEPVAEEAPL